MEKPEMIGAEKIILLFLCAAMIFTAAFLEMSEGMRGYAKHLDPNMSRTALAASVVGPKPLTNKDADEAEEDVPEEGYEEKKENSDSFASSETDAERKEVYALGSTESIPLSRKELDVLLSACNEYGVGPAFALAMIETESTFNPNAVNKAGTCYSYMQINKVNESWLKNAIGIESINDPEDNIKAGVYMISGYLKKYGSESMALMCYNSGEGGAKAKFANGITETGYTQAVQQRTDAWAEVLRSEGYSVREDSPQPAEPVQQSVTEETVPEKQETVPESGSEAVAPEGAEEERPSEDGRVDVFDMYEIDEVIVEEIEIKDPDSLPNPGE